MSMSYWIKRLFLLKVFLGLLFLVGSQVNFIGSYFHNIWQNVASSKLSLNDSSNSEPSALSFGNPSQAKTSDKNNYLLESENYTLSYNSERGTPNWVAWILTKEDFGTEERQNDFRPDERLPWGKSVITPADYTGSGYDRGHLCPSADRTSDKKRNSETFRMTNIIPQEPTLNRGAWEKLERFSRSIARRSDFVYIISGISGEKQRLRGKVSVPEFIWKIVLVPDSTDIKSITGKSRIIAVWLPNDSSVTEWRDFKTTAGEIETKTGYKFFSNLPKNTRQELLTKKDRD